MNEEDIRLATEWYRNSVKDNPYNTDEISDDDNELLIKVLAENDYVMYALAQHDEGNENVTIEDYRAYCRERNNA